MKKKHSLFLLLPAVAMICAGCNGKKDPGTNTGGNTDSGQTDNDHGGSGDEGGGGGEQQTVAVTGVTLNKNAATIEVGKKETLVATVAPENATNKNVTWESSAPEVATVANGEVTAKAAGTAEITVTTTDGGKTAKCVVTVNQAQQQTNYGTAEAPITVTQASAIAAAECVADGNLTAQEITVKGTVKAIKNTYHYDGIPCFEFDITDGTTDMYVYRCHTTVEQEALFVVGAKVTIVGFVKNFKNTIEFVDNGNDHQCHVISLEAEGVATPVSISALAGLPESVYVGDTLSAQGITASVLFTDGSSKDLPVSEITLNTSVAGQITGVAHYGQLQKEFVMTVLPLPEKVVGDFYRVASQDDITEGQYLIVYEGTEGAKIFNGLDTANGCVDAQATGGHIVANGALPKVELEAMDGGFAIKVLAGDNANKYISGKSGNNALQFKTEQGLNEILHKEDGSDSIVSNETFLRFNNASDQQRFRYYKTESQKPVHLYKMHEVKVPVLDSLELTHAPDKQSYYVGDTFDPTGMVITAKYTNDGEDKIIPGTDYTISPLQLELGVDHVTVSYNEGDVEKTVDVPVTVTKAPVPVTGITLDKTELAIKVNDQDVTLVATVSPDDADDKTVVWSVSEEGIVTVNGGVIHAVAEGTVTVTATAGSFHADCLVTVGAAEKIISGIEVVTPPTKVVYVEGETFDPTGMVIQVNYSSGHESITVTTGFTYSDAQLQQGTEAVDIEYNGFHASVAITTNPAPVLDSITVANAPEKDNAYVAGEVISKEDLVVTAHYTQGKADAVVTDYVISKTEALVEDDTSVTITYVEGGVEKTAVYEFTVSPAPVLDSITVANAEGKSNEYFVGDIISKEDLVVTAHYTQGKADAIVTDYVISKTEALSAEDTSVTITYTEGGVEKTAVYAISVAEPAREAIPYVTTIDPSTHLFVNWTGDAEAFSSTYPVLKGSGKAISYVKMFDARNKVRVVVDGVCNGTTTDSLVTVYGLDDTGAPIEEASEAFTPKKASASNGAAVDNAAAKNTVILEGEGITGIKVELTTKGHNYVMRSIEVKEPPVAVTGVSLDKTELTMKVNEADETLVATVAPENAENKEVVWSSDNEPVATVNNGVIHAVSAGTAHITVTTADGSKTATCTVTVQASEKILTGIEVTGAPTKTEYFVGDKFDPAGMVVTAHYSNAADEAITGYTYSDEALVAGQTAVVISWNGQVADCPITVAVPKGSTVDNPFTIAEVIEASSGLGDNQWLPTRVFVEGKVKGYAASSSNKYTLVDESGTEFIVYKSQLPSGDRACIGDTVIMEGWVENFHPNTGDNVLEMTSYNDGIHNDLPTTASILSRGESNIVVDSSVEHATVNVQSTATNASTIQFTVSAESGYEIKEVSYKVGQETKATVIEGNEGTYSLKVLGKITILVETGVEGEEAPTAYKTATFAATNSTNSVQNYTSNATYTTDGFVVTTQNFNNNKLGWDMIKCGRKKPSSGSGASVALIETEQIDKKIVEVAIDFDACTTTALKEAYILVSDNAEMTSATKVGFTVVGNSIVKVEIPENNQIENGYYQIVFDCNEGSANGFIAIKGVSFNIAE